jgi:hypothetical protein
MKECSFETRYEALEVIKAIPTTLFVGLMKEETEVYPKLLEEAGATVTIEKSDMKEHATTITQEFLDQLHGKEPNTDDYYEFISTEKSPAEETLKEKEAPAEEAAEEAPDEEAPVEEPNIDDKGWTTFNEFKSTVNPPVTDFPEITKYDVWIKSVYNNKVCNAIINITNWDAPVAGKFLLDLEDYGDAKKLVEEIDIDEAERIKNKLEKAGARVTVESHI